MERIEMALQALGEKIVRVENGVRREECFRKAREDELVSIRLGITESCGVERRAREESCDEIRKHVRILEDVAERTARKLSCMRAEGKMLMDSPARINMAAQTLSELPAPSLTVQGFLPQGSAGDRMTQDQGDPSTKSPMTIGKTQEDAQETGQKPVDAMPGPSWHRTELAKVSAKELERNAEAAYIAVMQTHGFVKEVRILGLERTGSWRWRTVEGGPYDSDSTVWKTALAEAKGVAEQIDPGHFGDR